MSPKIHSNSKDRSMLFSEASMPELLLIMAYVEILS